MLVQVPIRHVTRALAGLVLFFATAHVAVLLLHELYESRVTELLVEKFSVDLERNFPAFFSSLLLLFSSVLFFLISWSLKQRGASADYRHWVGLGCIFLFLSIDEAAHIHEHFRTEMIWGDFKPGGAFAWPWVIVYGVLVIIFVASYFRFWLRLQAPFRLFYFAAGACYVGSALGFEMLEAADYAQNHGVYTLKYVVLSSFEEVFEMVAITFLIMTNLRYLATTSQEFLFTIDTGKPLHRA